VIKFSPGELHRKRKKEPNKFSSYLLQLLANLNENFRYYSRGNAEFEYLKMISLFVKYSLLAAM